jgi:hypothetical protein
LALTKATRRSIPEDGILIPSILTNWRCVELPWNLSFHAHYVPFLRN